MFRLAYLASLSLLLIVGSLHAQPATHQVKLNGHTFTLPQGFTIEVAANADMAPRPIAAAFDEKGRLYVTDSSGSNEKTAVQVEKKPHRIVRLESSKNDGKFDKQTVFVKNVMFPEGCMWLNGSLYVAAPPHIWKFTDTNDDGVADKEEIWFDGKTLTGCANDLHGPYLGPDGYIYWCKGAFAQQEYTLANGKKFTTRASHIFRATPDGKKIEPVMTGGMDNPVDLVFTPGGEIIFSTTFFQHPRDGKRDGLIHAVYGAVYGKDHDPVYQHPWTQPTLMPPMTHMGPAAPCGLHRLESSEFGKEYENNVFCCQFNMRKVSRHVLVPTGSTYTTKDSDFVVSDNIDFHPTDVIEDADGSLLIVDTGGWYKLCCPTSQLVKPDVTGAIYRVKRDGAHKMDDPRGLKIDWKGMTEAKYIAALKDRRPAVVQRVIEEAGKLDTKAIVWVSSVLGDNSAPTRARVAAIWAMFRISHPDAREWTRLSLLNADPELRLAALHSIAIGREAFSTGQLPSMMNDLVRLKRPPFTDSHLRVIAEAMGRVGDARAIPTLFKLLADERNDRALDHALTYALIEIGDAKALGAIAFSHPSGNSPQVMRALLVALEYIPDSGLEAKFVLRYLDAKDAALRDTAWWIAGRHPQWGDQLTDYFRTQLGRADKLTPTEQEALTDHLIKFAKVESVQRMFGDMMKSAPQAGRLIALRVMARSGLKQMPQEWASAVYISAGDPELVREGLAVARAVQMTPDDYKRVASAFDKAGVPDDQRLMFLAAAPPEFRLDATGFTLARDSIGKEQPAALRSAAADVLARANLTNPQFIALAVNLKRAGPLDVTKLIGVFAKSTDEKVGLMLVKALREPELRGVVRTEMVKPILDKYPQAVKDEAEKLYAELAEARKGETAKLDKLLAELKPGDIRRGQLVFNHAKTQCIACHKVGYVGGLIGPDLTRIGGIRSERDLLEAIVFPSASFVRSYEPVRVVTTDERTFNGVLKKDAPDEVIIVVAADKEERVSRADIASISPSTVSLMPSGLDQQLSPQDLADLVAFLKACK